MSDEPKKYRALLDLALRKSPDPADPLYEEWHEWPTGTVFEAPAHLKIELGLEGGKFVEVGPDGMDVVSGDGSGVALPPIDEPAEVRVMERGDG